MKVNPARTYNHIDDARTATDDLFNLPSRLSGNESYEYGERRTIY